MHLIFLNSYIYCSVGTLTDIGYISSGYVFGFRKLGKHYCDFVQSTKDLLLLTEVVEFICIGLPGQNFNELANEIYFKFVMPTATGKWKAENNSLFSVTVL